MSVRRDPGLVRRAGGLTALGLMLALAACSTTSRAPVTVQAQQAEAERVLAGQDGPASALDQAEALARLGYARNTSWSFATAEETYRDLALLDPNLAGRATLIEARINRGINLSNVGLFPQAAAEFNGAAAALQTETVPILEVRLALARAIDAGNRASRLTGEPRREAFAASRAAADETLVQAKRALESVGSQVTAAAVRADDGSILIGAASAARYNEFASRGNRNASATIGARMSDAERIAILRVHALFSRAAAEAALGDLSAAFASNAEAQEALDGLPPSFAAWLRASVAEQRGSLALLRGEPQVAESAVSGAIFTLRRTYADTRLEAALWRTLARAQAAQGNTDRAIGSEKSAFGIITRQSDGILPTRGEVAPYLKLLAPVAISGNQDSVAEFFRAASVSVETATARTVAQVAARFATGDSETAQAIRQVQDAEREVRRLKVRETLVAGSTEATEEERRQAALDVVEGEKRLAAIKEAAAAVSGQRAGAFISNETSLADLQTALKPGEAYVRFIFSPEGEGYGAIATANGAKVYRLGMTEAEVQKAVNEVRAFTNVVVIQMPDGTTQRRRPPFRVDSSAALYAALFGPAEDILRGTDSLIVEPAGPLFSLPFAALATAPLEGEALQAFIASRGQDYTGVKWLGRDRTITLSVGAAGFVRLRDSRPSSAPQPLLAFADPIPAVNVEQAALTIGTQRSLRSESVSTLASTTEGTAIDAALKVRGDNPICVREAQLVLGFAPLPDTGTEVRAVATALGAESSRSVVSGADFTDTAVRQRTDLNQYRILYFATHGVLPDAFQCWPDPFLSTSTTGGSDGALEATEIADLNLDADLVVLSACDTAGSGGASADSGLEGAGEALGGLAQSFTFAGSRGLLVSHWAVDSKRTAELMTSLFQSSDASSSTPRALTVAQRSLMAKPEASHPYYWAAFTLVGEGVRKSGS